MPTSYRAHIPYRSSIPYRGVSGGGGGTSPAWSLDIYDMAGAAVLLNAPFESVVPTWSLNDPGGLEASFPMSVVSFVDLDPDEGREVKFRRQGSVIWGGYLERCSFNTRGDRQVKIQAEGYLSRAGGMFLDADLQFNGATQEAIAWGLLNAGQGLPDAAYGFTQGTHTGPSVVRTRTYCAEERPNVLDEIGHLTEFSDGLDVAIRDSNKKLDTWSPRRGVASGVTIGGDLMEGDGEIDLADTANYVDAIGSDDCGAVIATAVDVTAGARLKRRGVVIDSDATEPDEVLANADEYLRAHKDARWKANVTYHEAEGPAWGSYDIGDTLTLDLSEDFATFTKTMRLIERTLTIQLPTDTGVFFTEVLDSAV